MNFDYSTPTRIVFGRGRLPELGELTAQHGRRCLLVTGRRAMRAAGHLQRAVASLQSAGVETFVFDDISRNPRSDEVDAGAKLANGLGIDVIAGLGGGSAIDAAKAIAAGAMHGPCGPLVGQTLVSHPKARPIVAVPTTAGTGSEVTKGAIILDVERKFKSGIRGEDLFPKVALVDSELTEGAPPEVAVETAFDALTHAIESYLARMSNPISRALSREAIILLQHGLPRVAAGTVDHSVRDRLAMAALIGGLNVATASSCLPHRLQQSMGSITRVDLSHARGLAIIYPAWLRRVAIAAPDAFAEIATLLGAKDGVARLAELIDEVGMSARLSQVGYREEDIQCLVENVSGNLENDPIPDIGKPTIRAIYEEVF
ncbi:iron-containing alcohol dehydrogenase [Phormidium willei BDU 130791]|nr:iron-containing alcohol dehydrogenase [Phormidium willei BDU 130791]